MYVFPAQNPRIAFILHPKTATRSIESVLRSLRFKSVKARHSIVPEILTDILSRGGIVAGTLRNPLDMLVSWYYYVHRHGGVIPPFEEWLDRTISRPHTYLGPGKPLFYGAPWMNWTIKYELGVEQQMRTLLDLQLGMSIGEFPHIGAASDRQGYPMYFNARQRKMVTERWRDDFAYGEYI